MIAAPRHRCHSLEKGRKERRRIFGLSRPAQPFLAGAGLVVWW